MSDLTNLDALRLASAVYAERARAADGRDPDDAENALALAVATALSTLWAPTPTALISKLPKGGRGGENVSCDVCHGMHKPGAIHLDYLGHSDTTRLIAAVDPFWSWEPIGGFDDDGEPRFIRDQSGYPIRLWGRLTILGVTRPGVGTCERGKGDPEKELIGDFLRNSALRFGIGADLWSKAFRAGIELDSHNDSPQPRRQANGHSSPSRPAPLPPEDTPDSRARHAGWLNEDDRLALKAAMGALAQVAGPDAVSVVKAWQAANGVGTASASGWEMTMAALGIAATSPGIDAAELHERLLAHPPRPIPRDQRGEAIAHAIASLSPQRVDRAVETPPAPAPIPRTPAEVAAALERAQRAQAALVAAREAHDAPQSAPSASERPATPDDAPTTPEAAPVPDIVVAADAILVEAGHPKLTETRDAALRASARKASLDATGTAAQVRERVARWIVDASAAPA